MPVLPMSYDDIKTSPSFLFVMQTNCNTHLNKTNVVLWDIAGAVGGGMLGSIASPAGTLMGALSGGLAGSAIEGTYQIGSYAWCRVRGGGGSGVGTEHPK